MRLTREAQAVYALARHLRIPIAHGKYNGWQYEKEAKAHYEGGGQGFPFWDGKILWVEGYADIDSVLHEIAHFVESSHQARHLPNFGLDDDPTGEDRERRADLIQKGLHAALTAMMGEVVE